MQGLCAQSNDIPIAKLSFWGVREVYAEVDRRHGATSGNTPCLELMHRRHAVHSGLRHGAAHAGEPLGRAKRRKSSETHILVTHYTGITSRGFRFFRRCMWKTTISFL